MSFVNFIRRTEPRPRRSYSLSLQFTTQMVVITCLIVLLSAAVMHYVVARELAAMDDKTLEIRMETIRQILTVHKDHEILLAHEVHEYVEGLRPIYSRILLPSGQVWMETPGMPATLPDLGNQATGDSRGVFYPLTMSEASNGRPIRILTERIVGPTPTGAIPYLVQVAIDTQRDYELMSRYRQALFPVLALAFVSAGLLGWRCAKRASAPIARVKEASAGITSQTLHARLDVEGLPSELFGLVDTLNQMLARLERSHLALQEFTDDVAHELRTPINNIRLSAEVALANRRSEEEYQSTLESQLEECERLTRLVSDLLFLAQDTNNQASHDRQLIDVAHELTVIEAYFESSLEERQLTLAITCPPGLRVRANRVLFQRAIANLVGNAISHTPNAGSLRVSAETKGTRLRLTISDSGEGIAQEHLPHIFDRFYRATRNRPAADRLGLGLSIVKKIVEHHHGTVSVTSEPGRGTSVALDFPLHE